MLMNARFISLAQPDPLSSRLLANLTFPLACFIVLSNLTLCPLQNSFLLFFFNYEIHRILLLSNILGFGFLFLINLFIYFWLSWIFVAAHGLSLVVILFNLFTFEYDHSGRELLNCGTLNIFG